MNLDWLKRVARLTKFGWKKFANDEKESIRVIRDEIYELATATGLQIPEYRKIVAMVQKGEREARIAKKEMVEATCASSFPSPRNTPTAACSSSISSRGQYRPDEGGG